MCRRRSQIRTQLLQIWTLSLMLYLWSKKQLSKKYDLTLRLCGSLHRALTAKSHKITFQIQEINCQKILCMQQNDIKFLTNFQVEKKFLTFAQIWTPQLPFHFNNKRVQIISFPTLLKVVAALMQCSLIQLLNALPRLLGCLNL